MQPHLGLQVTLVSQLPTLQTQSSFTLPVKVSVQNTGSDPVTFLKWGTPFDAHAAVSGVFEVRDTADGTVLPLDVLKMSRKLPASTEDLLEVAGGQSLDNIVELPGLNLQEGHGYSIITQGIWHAIWKAPRVDVTVSQLSDFSGASRDTVAFGVLLWISSTHMIQSGPSYQISPKKDAKNVFRVLQNGGVAIIPSDVGYGIVAIDPGAIPRIFVAKRRQPHKRHAMICNYDLQKQIHIIDSREAEMVRLLTVDLDLPVGVVASYRPDHPIIQKIPQDLLHESSIDGTMAMLVNGGEFQEELSKLATDAELPLLGSSANLTGTGTNVAIEEIEPEIRAVADIIVDYGRQKYSRPRPSSTMINFDELRVLRFGACYEVIQDVFSRFYGLPLPNDPGRDILFSGHLRQHRDSD